MCLEVNVILTLWSKKNVLSLCTGGPGAWGTTRAAWSPRTSGKIENSHLPLCCILKTEFTYKIIKKKYWAFKLVQTVIVFVFLYFVYFIEQYNRNFQKKSSPVFNLPSTHSLISASSPSLWTVCGRALQDEAACLDWKVIRWSKYLYYCSVSVCNVWLY